VWAGDGAVETPSLTVAVHNHADVSTSTLAEAERTASLIFKKTGVEVEFVNCDAGFQAGQRDPSCQVTKFPDHLQLALAQRSRNLTDSIFGVSYLGDDGSGCYSNVFLGPAEELHERVHVGLGALLGHVMAHEIAHLLLGTNAHSPLGIMRAHWDERDLANISRGQLLFSAAQGQTMRANMAANARPKARLVAVTRPVAE
jgi:hypothetical protein